jgi:hypothetical protein
LSKQWHSRGPQETFWWPKTEASLFAFVVKGARRTTNLALWEGRRAMDTAPLLRPAGRRKGTPWLFTLLGCSLVMCGCLMVITFRSAPGPVVVYGNDDGTSGDLSSLQGGLRNIQNRVNHDMDDNSKLISAYEKRFAGDRGRTGADSETGKSKPPAPCTGLLCTASQAFGNNWLDKAGSPVNA